MKYTPKKELIYGCMGLGGDWDNKTLTKEHYKTAEKAIEAALETGITFFDHADIYKLGKAETVFGQILKSNPSLRDKMIIQSKAGICYHEGVDKSNVYNLSKKYLLDQVDAILGRLKTEYLDVFLLHRPDPLMNPEEISETFNQLKRSGKVNYFGVSNMSHHQLDNLQKCYGEPLIANQIQFSLGHSLLIDTGILVNRINNIDFNGVEGMLEYLQTNNIAIQAWGSLDKGRFTGNSSLASANDKKTITLVSHLAEKYNTTNESIVLAWLFTIPGIVQPIIGSTNTERILACKEATTIKLSRVDWYNLWISARGQRIP